MGSVLGDFICLSDLLLVLKVLELHKAVFLLNRQSEFAAPG